MRLDDTQQEHPPRRVLYLIATLSSLATAVFFLQRRETHLRNITTLPSKSSSHNRNRRKREPVDNLKRIVGGEVLPFNNRNRYPYQVAIFSATNKRQPICAGSLIASNVVLTAAHCNKRQSDLEVKIGLYDFERPELSSDVESFKIVNHVYHFDNNINNDADVVLYQLDGHSKKDPIKIVDHETFRDLQPAQILWAMGWGKTSVWGDASPKLRHVPLNYVPNETCRSIYERYWENAITDYMFCAKGDAKDACQGDSGGPLILKGQSSDDDMLVGCVSWGVGCVDARYPGVYGNLDKMRDWIRETACGMSEGGKPNRFCEDHGLSKNIQTPSPTPSPIRDCVKKQQNGDDMECFYGSRSVKRDCTWIRNAPKPEKKWRRCHKYGCDYCPVTCKMYLLLGC